ncbi:MAG: hypothetical protein KF752_05240 [Pirellulaceae bacterium]|nr:hypothetical protein [Pirellulaceae bacterium]
MNQRYHAKIKDKPSLAITWLLLIAVSGQAEEPSIHPDRFGIQVVDEQGRGVPLVELRTVNEIRCVTDNSGWIAWDEPGLMDCEVFWHVTGPGIEREKDGFGYPGFRAVTKRGTYAVCEVSTSNIATRIRRLTGQGQYHHLEALGLPIPLENILEPGVVGQDSVQAVAYNGKLFWLWGDTSQARYPLGNFHTTSATTPSDIDPESAFAFEYFRNQENPQLLRRMMPTDKPGVVWMFGLMSLTDQQQRERLFAGFSRRPGLETAHEQGVAEFDPDAGHFRKVADTAKDNQWTFPHGYACRTKTSDGEHFYFCRPFAHVRVAANVASITDATQYEVLQWQAAQSAWRWQAGLVPTTQEEESKLLKSGKISSKQVRYQVQDAATGRAVHLHTASITWNEFRQRFIMIALEFTSHKSSPSLLGELWYVESDAITGPWQRAVKIASHPHYSFYNPIHHTFLDRQGGRIIYFEGTYTHQFSGNKSPTARYDYNQILYRLDLADERLMPSHK